MKVICGKSLDDHTVIQGTIEEVVNVGGIYVVYFEKERVTRSNVSSDFDDIGMRKTEELYHYSQKSKGV